MDRGDYRFVPGLLELPIYRGKSDPGMGPYPPWVRRGPDVVPRGTSRPARAR